jgi:hypothetical protein
VIAAGTSCGFVAPYTLISILGSLFAVSANPAACTPSSANILAGMIRSTSILSAHSWWMLSGSFE